MIVRIAEVATAILAIASMFQLGRKDRAGWATKAAAQATGAYIMWHHGLYAFFVLSWFGFGLAVANWQRWGRA